MLSGLSQLWILFLYICVAANGSKNVRATEHTDQFKQDVFASLYQGEQIANELYRREQAISHDIACTEAMPDFSHQASHRASLATMAKARKSYAYLMAAKMLHRQMAAKYGVTRNSFSEFLNANGFPVLDVPPEVCEADHRVQCDPHHIYRTWDGSCNNLVSPAFGKAGTALERLLPARYEDGVYAPRLSVTGLPLPSARLISRTLFQDEPITDPHISQAFVVFGQLLAHDFSSIVLSQTEAGGVRCCAADGSGVVALPVRHHACFPIHIPQGDGFFSRFLQRCMNLVRSLPTPRDECVLGPADQLNAVSSFLDASPVYGSDHQTAMSLRSFFFGQLIYELKGNKMYLPDSGNSSMCDKRDGSDSCYRAGDNRVNQNPLLTLIQTVLLRQHNMLAEGLAQLNPHWDDERLYQEARHIVIAILQKITYHDWLPILIDPNYLVDHKIVHSKPGHSHDYNPTVNSGILNEFTTSAYRYLHSMVSGRISVLSEDRIEHVRVPLREYFNRPSRLLEEHHFFDGLLRGLTSVPAMAADPYFSEEITQGLFASTRPFGLDLESFDIQRGRDHGLDSYVNYRTLCGFPKVASFDHLQDVIPQERLDVLRQVYHDVGDIDLFVGASLEGHLPGSLLGPTNQCIIGEEFFRRRLGDRFFFDSDSNPNRLTEFQLHEVKKMTVARVLCDAGDDLRTMQPDAFRPIDERNPLIPCEEIPRLDLRAWQEAF